MRSLKNRKVVGVACILAALLLCFVVAPLFNGSATATAKIIRAGRDIPAGSEITASMLQTVEVGSYNLPDGVLHQADSAVGKYAARDITAGDYLLPVKLSDSPANEDSYLYSLDGGKQAISVTIKSFAAGLSGKLQSGDIVTVIAPDYRGLGSTVIPPEVQYLEVVSVTASSGFDANTGSSPQAEEDEKELPATVTLLATPEQSRVLAELESDGKLHISLVYRGGGDGASKFLDVQQAVLDELYAAPAEDTNEVDHGAPEL
ncbi:Flp pilus assembly protein CpaB [Pseudoflavonifractor phocaeensis]|uniref:Flp pilus assembly protein CpaB n=1 Tax=Pseudoflavonifractor phocaeensis TaxID=1870988 RepID=UPI00210E7B57|nr:Flp pilus assembly protein CpaB [Pseudoflavonifractor phocaeensis]MCQ4862672.1 Flp pilus assembly protein CpaB [Pseudoflavonifractor phocaeensis]